MQYQFISQNSSEFGIDEMCECFGLKRSGYYGWKARKPSAREVEDQCKHSTRTSSR